MSDTSFAVFTRTGDATAEVDRLVRELGGSAEAAGLHKSMYVTRADQTVVMTSGPDAPLADALRGRSGWREPRE